MGVLRGANNAVIMENDLSNNQVVQVNIASIGENACKVRLHLDMRKGKDKNIRRLQSFKVAKRRVLVAQMIKGNDVDCTPSFDTMKVDF